MLKTKLQNTSALYGNINKISNSKRKKLSLPKKTWYNAECERKRKAFHSAIKHLSDSADAHAIYHDASRDHKRTLNKSFQTINMSLRKNTYSALQ